jgi:preprotein translocase subunit SecE
MNKKLNIFYWILIVILLASGIVANYYLNSVMLSLRMAGWVVLLCVLGAILFLTSQGKALWKFVKEVNVELRKVVWPDRKDTIRTTIIVAVLVILTALIVWAMDSILLWLFSWFTA